MEPREQPVVKIGQLEIRYLLDGTEAGAAMGMFELIVPPGARVPPPHSHSDNAGGDRQDRGVVNAARRDAEGGAQHAPLVFAARSFATQELRAAPAGLAAVRHAGSGSARGNGNPQAAMT